MGHHRHPLPAKARPADDIEFGAGWQAELTPNADKLSKIDAEAARCKGAGLPVPVVDVAPHEMDVVVYGSVRVLRRKTPGGLALPQSRALVTTVRGPELFRMPLAAVLAAEGEKLQEVFGKLSEEG